MLRTLIRGLNSTWRSFLSLILREDSRDPLPLLLPVPLVECDCSLKEANEGSSSKFNDLEHAEEFEEQELEPQQGFLEE
jgi:hypothetical protein